jgi:tryptophanyl-tRNA synthetase
MAADILLYDAEIVPVVKTNTASEITVMWLQDSNRKWRKHLFYQRLNQYVDFGTNGGKMSKSADIITNIFLR